MKTVLIVDDSPTLRASVEFTLSAQGYDVLQADNGSVALELLSGMAAAGRRPDVIITDVNMPLTDGLTFIRKVKRTPMRFVPILVMTTESQQSMKNDGKQAGAAGWLVKPFKPQQLVDVVAKFAP